LAGRTREERYIAAGDLPLYPVDASRGWRVIRYVNFAKGLERAAKGEWALRNDEQGNPWYFQIVASFKTDQDLPSGATSSSITSRECMLNAGVIEKRNGVILGAKSRTMRMTEDERLSQPKRPNGRVPPPEDAIERAIAKVREWPLPHGDRSVRVYPKQP
jgi:hypothetical protein